MKTTGKSGRSGRPEAEVDRECAWGHMLETPAGIRRRDPFDLEFDERRLGEIARRYDQICRRAQGRLQPEASETDVFAALLVIRMLREKLLTDELMLITLARSMGITWTRVADALEMKSRQSAERRHLQLSQSTRADGSLPRTQNERVEHARERRSRHAEREWALRNAHAIHAVAQALTTVPDLQQRVIRSPEAALMAAPVNQDGTAPKPVYMTWPSALRECLAEHLRFRENPRAHLSPERLYVGDDQWQFQQHEADILHHMVRPAALRGGSAAPGPVRPPRAPGAGSPAHYGSGGLPPSLTLAPAARRFGPCHHGADRRADRLTSRPHRRGVGQGRVGRAWHDLASACPC
ncbi:hypothetical protein [Streptomyces parvus]|uniref:hypothetical protein n=1 Tax=Streptomyces parvus TaxID=66428 RepID=UPI0036351476